MTVKIAILTKAAVSVDSLERAFQAYMPLVVCSSREELKAAAATADFIVAQNKGFGFRIIDDDLLKQAKNLKLIQHHGVMYDATDAQAAKALGIPVAVTPGSNSVSVAEIAWHILMCVAKRLGPMQQSLTDGVMGRVMGTELAHKTVCIVGIGNIGKAIARMAKGFDMRVVGVRQSAVLDDEARAAGISTVYEVARLNEALAESDFVVLALPLNDATYNLMDEGRFAAMKPGAMLVNVSRGNHVKRAALESALAGGRLGGYGTDVWWTEPADPKDLLLKNPMVYVTPHVGGETREAIDRMSIAARENIDRFLQGKTVLDVVNG
jgi:phosphoglycerate dehydrogenase-like enzyme